MMPTDDSKHWAKIQAEMDRMGTSHTKNSAKQAREIMSDMDYSHCQHEMSESPKYEAMEERAVKMMRSKMKPGGSY